MLSRTATKAAQGVRRGVRQMSSHGSPEQIFQEKEMWLKTSVFMGGALMIPYTAFVVFKELTHEHSHDEHVTYPHMHVRRKAFPWAANQCDFFELKCHRDFAAGNASSSHH